MDEPSSFPNVFPLNIICVTYIGNTLTYQDVGAVLVVGEATWVLDTKKYSMVYEDYIVASIITLIK